MINQAFLLLDIGALVGVQSESFIINLSCFPFSGGCLTVAASSMRICIEPSDLLIAVFGYETAPGKMLIRRVKSNN